MLEGRTPRFVSAAEITRNFGMWQDRAAQGPLIVTHHGRPRVAVVAIERYDALAGLHAAGEGAEGIEAARLSTVLAQVGAAFLSVDDGLRVTRINPMAVALLGVAEDRLLGRTLDEALPLSHGGFVQQFREALRAGEELAAEVPAGPRRLKLRVFPYPGGLAAIFRGASGAEATRLADREAIAQMQARTAHGAIGTARIDPRGALERVERDFAAMTGFATERLAGVRLTHLLALTDRPAVEAAVEAVTAGRGPQAADATLVAQGAEDRPVRLAFAELRDGYAISGATVLMTAC